MTWTKIKALCKVNFLYSNPQLMAGIQKKQEKKDKAAFNPSKELLKQYLLQFVLFSGIYGFMFFGIDYRAMAGYFSIQMGIFSLMALIGVFSTYFSVFYNSKDNKLYLPLPVTGQEVYLAKFLASQGGNIFLFILLPLLGLAYWQLRGWVGLLFIPLSFLSIWAMVNLLGLLLNGLIGALIAKSPYRKVISGILLTLATIMPIGLVFFINATTTAIKFEDNLPQVLFTNLPYFRGFYDVVVNPFSLDSLIHFWSAFVGLILGTVFIFKVIVPQYFKQILQMEEVQTKKAKKIKKTTGSLKQVWLRHHLSTLKDNTLLINAYLSPILMTGSFVTPLVIEGGLRDKLEPSFYGIAILIGLAFGAIVSGMTSLLSVGISLERENLHFIKTLPIGFKTFLQEKYLILWMVQVLPVLVIKLILALVIHLPWYLVLPYSLAFLLSSHLVGLFVYKRDYQQLYLNWQNIIQLFNRGSSNFLKGLLFFALYIGSILVIGLAIFLSIIFNPIWVSNNIVILTLLLAAWGYYHIHKTFWEKLDKDEKI